MRLIKEFIKQRKEFDEVDKKITNDLKNQKLRHQSMIKENEIFRSSVQKRINAIRNK